MKLSHLGNKRMSAVAQNGSQAPAQPEQSGSGSTQTDQLYGKLQAAGRVVEERLARDAKASGLDLDAMLFSNAPTSSEYAIAQNMNGQPFSLKRSIPLPDMLWEQFDRMSAACCAGFD